MVGVEGERTGASRIRPASAQKASAAQEVLDLPEIANTAAHAPVDYSLRVDVSRRTVIRVHVPPAVRRVVRFARDLVVLSCVLDVSLQFVDAVHHPIVAGIFVLASVAAALRQMTALRTATAPTTPGSRSRYAWAAAGVASWLAATYAASHQWFEGTVPPMPLPVQAVGAACLIFAVMIPFLRIPRVAGSAFATCPHAIGGVLLTGNPILAMLVAAWLAHTCQTAWRASRPRALSPALSPAIVDPAAAVARLAA